MDEIRVQRLLREQQHLMRSDEGRKALMYEIAPLLCQNETQQAFFYQIYQKYLQEDLQQSEKDKTITKSFNTFKETQKETSKKQQHWLLAQLGLTLLTIAWWIISYHLNPPVPNIHFSAATNSIVLAKELRLQNNSDTLYTKYPTFGKTVNLDFKWFIIDNQGDTLHRDSTHHLQWAVPDSLTSENLTVHLHGIHSKLSTYLENHQQQFKLLCNSLEVGNISVHEGESHLFPDSVLTFSVDVETKNEAHLIYQWSFEEVGMVYDIHPKYSYDKEGVYTVSVKVIDTLNTFGFCEKEARTSINIQSKGTDPDSLIALTPFALEEIKPLVHHQLSLWVYPLLLSLLGLTAWLWWKWHHRPDPNQALAKAKAIALQNRFDAPDKSPYSIPFKNGAGKIRAAADQYTIAANLRKRQEGLRKEIDIAATINSTVQQAGFVNWQFKTNTRPTHYLVLIDWQNAKSHQARLFQYLTEMLQQQDVLFDVFFYQGDFNRIWNKKYPKGISLQQLNQLYANQRLLIFGDAHALVKQAPQGKLTQPNWSKILRKWTNRILITPVPIVSWTYLEARLYCLFPIFSGDLDGVLQSVQFLVDGKTEEDLPNTLEKWEAQLRKSQIETTINRQWYDLDHYKNYLEDHPEVLRWLKALAVYPNPTWNITLAIGHALGVSVTYDNLLLMARVPWLQQGAFSMDLWEEIWDELPKADELTARSAVKAELKTVRSQTANAFANQELEQDLAIQEFILQPKVTDHQAAIQYLHKTNLLPEIHLEELDIAVERHTDFKQRGKKIGETLGYYLKAETDAKKQTEKRLPFPFYTRSFWWAAFASLLSSLAILSSILAPVECPIVDKITEMPSEAAKYNNRGVQVAKGATISSIELQSLPINEETIGNYTFSTAALLFRNAISLDSNLVEAQSNLLKVLHNEGIAEYTKLVDNNEHDVQNLAIPPLNAAIRLPSTYRLDSIRHAAMYALACVHHELKEATAVCDLLDTLRKVSELVHFQAIPNLETKATYCQLETTFSIFDSLEIEVVFENPEPCITASCETNKQWKVKIVTPIENLYLNTFSLIGEDNITEIISSKNTINLLVTNGQTYFPRVNLSYGDKEIKRDGKKVTFKDCESPQILVNDKINTVLGPQGNAIISTTYLVEDFSDNCTNKSKLQSNIRIWHSSLGIEPNNIRRIKSLGETITLGCNHLGQQRVVVFIFDDNDNWSKAEGMVDLEDNQNNCTTRQITSKSRFYLISHDVNKSVPDYPKYFNEVLNKMDKNRKIIYTFSELNDRFIDEMDNYNWTSGGNISQRENFVFKKANVNNLGGNNYVFASSVDEYRFFSPLKNGYKNTLEVFDTLRASYGFINAGISQDATRESFLNSIDALRSRFFKPNDQLLIYLNGYGYRNKNNEKIYFLPVATNPENLESTGINLDLIKGVLDDIPCNRILLVADLVYDFDLKQSEVSDNCQNEKVTLYGQFSNKVSSIKPNYKILEKSTNDTLITLHLHTTAVTSNRIEISRFEVVEGEKKFRKRIFI